MKLIKSKPYKQYKIDINSESQIKEMCKFLRSNKDKEISICINGSTTKFNSLVSQKKFAAGFESGSSIISGHAEKLFREQQGEINSLKQKLKGVGQSKENYDSEREKMRVDKEVIKIRIAAWEDRIAELESDREMLLKRLNDEP